MEALRNNNIRRKRDTHTHKAEPNETIQNEGNYTRTELKTDVSYKTIANRTGKKANPSILHAYDLNSIIITTECIYVFVHNGRDV